MSGRGATGFSLVEALVALVVVSTGLVGLAALQARALALARAAQLQSHAVDLAADFAERARAQRPGSPSPPLHAHQDDEAAASAPAGVDRPEWVIAWRQQVGRTLPNGAAEVLRDAGAPRYLISLEWEEPGSGRMDHRIEAWVGDE